MGPKRSKIQRLKTNIRYEKYSELKASFLAVSRVAQPAGALEPGCEEMERE